MKILLTSGGTQVPIDEVRYIHNMSTGRFGSDLAEEFLLNGHSVNQLYAKSSITPFTVNVNLLTENDPSIVYSQLSKKIMLMQSVVKNNESGYISVPYKTYDDYVERLEVEIDVFKPDVIVLSAAVSDYGVEPSDGKMSSDGDLTLTMKPLGKVIDKVREWAPDAYIVGFKLLVGSTPAELKNAAHKQLSRAKVDMVVGNDLREIRDGNHKLTIFYGDDQWTIDHDQAKELASFIEHVSKMKK